MPCPTDVSVTLPMRRPLATADEAVPTWLGDYLVVRRLGAGGMGVVYEGHHTALDRRAALKMIRRSMRRCESARARLVDEARALASIQHPNVVTLYELGASDDDAFIAMELVDGATLREWAHTPRAIPEVLDVFIAIARALGAVHAAGLVHRDVNPSNVFVTRDGTPKLGDFGLVTASGQRDEVVVGTPPYIAPEQTFGEPVDARADQYSFCMSLHEVLAGEDETADIPAPLRQIIGRGLAVRPEARFASIEALQEALRHARSGLARRWIGARALR